MDKAAVGSFHTVITDERRLAARRYRGLKVTDTFVIQGLNRLPGRPFGTVIHHDDFNRHAFLAQSALDCLQEELATPECRNDDGDVDQLDSRPGAPNGGRTFSARRSSLCAC